MSGRISCGDVCEVDSNAEVVGVACMQLWCDQLYLGWGWRDGGMVERERRGSSLDRDDGFFSGRPPLLSDPGPKIGLLYGYYVPYVELTNNK